MSHKRRCLHSTSTNLQRKGTYSLDTSLDSPLCCRLDRLSSLISLDYFRGKLKCQMILGWPALSWSWGAWVLAAVRNFGKSSSESPGIFLYKVGPIIMRYCWTQEGCAVSRLPRTQSVLHTGPETLPVCLDSAPPTHHTPCSPPPGQVERKSSRFCCSLPLSSTADHSGFPLSALWPVTDMGPLCFPGCHFLPDSHLSGNS